MSLFLIERTMRTHVYLRAMLTTEMLRMIDWSLQEDLGECDHTSASSLPEGLQREGWILAKEEGVVAGLEVAAEVFRRVSPELIIEKLSQDGDRVAYGQAVFRISGDARRILEGERLALNFIQRMSGIASRTADVMDSFQGTKCRVLDTRKTTPGLRAFEKWAVRLGGGTNHRMGLYDMILIKDNHVDYAGSVEEALNRVAKYLQELGRDLPVEIEVRDASESADAMRLQSMLCKPSGAPLIDRLLLDNHSPEEVRMQVERWGGQIDLEASGGITPSNALHYAETGVDYVSMGWLTHSVKGMDFSLKSTDTLI
jgi:nicotinate-nucleotide pyrophosphorylase (carboxylating)